MRRNVTRNGGTTAGVLVLHENLKNPSGVRNHALVTTGTVERPLSTTLTGRTSPITAHPVHRKQKRRIARSKNLVNPSQICGGKNNAPVGQVTPATASFAIGLTGATSLPTVSLVAIVSGKNPALRRDAETPSVSSFTIAMCPITAGTAKR
jgi:hypothetical protein